MLIAKVRHKPANKKLYAFEVPKKFEPYIKVGSSIMCETSRGKQFGVVEELIGCDTAKDVAEITNGNAISPLISVKTEVNIGDIRIPENFARTYPKEAKIEKRISELVIYGEFKTQIRFDTSLKLKDGYSAYVASKRLGRKTLSGVVY